MRCPHFRDCKADNLGRKSVVCIEVDLISEGFHCSTLCMHHSNNANFLFQEHLELNIEVFDDDYSDPSEFIDAIAISFGDMSLSTLAFTAPAVFNGTHGLTEATLSFRLEGAENYFGDNCTLFSTKADNDLIGHYLCDERGNRVCRGGYVNPSTACTQLAPLEGKPHTHTHSETCLGTTCIQGPHLYKDHLVVSQ